MRKIITIISILLVPLVIYGATTIYQGGNVTEIINPSSSGTHTLQTGGADLGLDLQGGTFKGTSGDTWDMSAVTVIGGGSTVAINAQTGTSYAIVDGDDRKLITQTNASAIAYTIGDPAVAGFDVGWYVDLNNYGAGTLTLTPDSPATIDGNATQVLTQNEGCRIVSDGTNFFTAGCSGIPAELDTGQSTFNRGTGKTTGINDGKPKFWTDSGGTNGMKCQQHSTRNWECITVVNGVDNDSNYLRGLNTGKKWGASILGGAELFTLTETSGVGVLTNVSLDVEGSSNLITTVSELSFLFASCIGASASNSWNDTGTADTVPTAACNDTGSIQRPSSDFAGGAVNSVEITFPLPTGWTGNIDLTIRYVTDASSPSGNVEWDISTVCRAVAEDWDASFNTAQTITDAVGADEALNDATQATLTTTGCAATEDFTVKVSRDGTNDSNNDLAKALYAKFTIRRVQ